jgi:hypothetical protein
MVVFMKRQACLYDMEIFKEKRTETFLYSGASRRLCSPCIELATPDLQVDQQWNSAKQVKRI